MFETKPLNKIIADAPYLSFLANACRCPANTLSQSDVSLTNYIAVTSGYTGCKTADPQGVCTAPLLDPGRPDLPAQVTARPPSGDPDDVRVVARRSDG
jgi:hypothetical protein